ncbi:hypothetical protein F5X99DRAFT_429009 [Biscogniauxia marginata]|nr:hypothetical protein F5X99DRAFT_429009 [Biscogniauxia marginata]
MSSMLKKTGGLSFKPKAGRRPGPASKPSTTSTPASNSITPAPTAETPSQTSTPSASTTTALNETPNHVPEETQPTTTSNSQSTAHSQVPTITIQPTPESTIPSTTPTTSESEPVSQAVASIEHTQDDRTPSSEPIPEVSNTDIRPTRDTAKFPSASPAVAPPDAAAQPISTSSTPPTNQHAQNRNVAVPQNAPPPPTPLPGTIAALPSADEASAPTAAPAPAPAPATRSTPAPKKRVPRKRKAPSAEEAPGTEGSAPKTRRPRKKTARTARDGTTPADSEDAIPASQVKKVIIRRRRSPTPEDAENMTVDHTTTKVGELTKDLGIGKRFKHAEAIKERARQARAAYRMKKLEREKRKLGILPEGDKDSESRAGTPAEGDEDQDDSGTAGAARGARAGAAASGQGVGYEVIDGQIIINSQSLVVDRHAAHQDMSMLETVEEDDFTNLTTSSSYRRESRRTGPNIWDDEETEKFYRLLKMFGTDFETIAAMFPGRSRRAIKLKFNREETLRPRRVNAAVMVRGEKKVGIDIDAYKASQKRWQTSDKILADHAKLVEEHNEHLKQLREERIAAGLMDDDTELDSGNSNNNNAGNKDKDRDAGAGHDPSAQLEGAENAEDADDTAVQGEGTQEASEAVAVA